MKALLPLLVLVLLPFSALGDRVVFKNGRTMSAEIVSETDTHVTLLDGGLKLTLSKSKLSSVERAAGNLPPPLDPPAAQTQSGTTFSIVTSGDKASGKTPEDFVGFVGKVAELDTKRILASRAKVDADGNLKRIDQLEREIKQTRLQSDTLMAGLKARQNDPVAYNASVKQANALRVIILNKQKQIDGCKAKVKAAQRTMNGYLNQSVQLIYSFQSAREEYETAHGDTYAPYFDRMEARLSVHRKTIKEVTVPHTTQGNTLIVEVVLNGTVKGSFIVDTGASFVTMHKAMAQRLNLPLDGPKVKTMLADGTIVPMPMVTLNTVQVGEARAERVNALISKDAPSPGVDGLLGMAFLKNFNLVFDPVSGKLTLTSLK
jgi:clan AA aspartic protease (TIGR02281 family)